MFTYNRFLTKRVMKLATILFIFLAQFTNTITCGAVPIDESDDVKFIQLKAQVHLFNQAIDELGATSPIQAATLWAKGEQKRNGVYQYSVAGKNLKEKMIQRWGPPEESLWVIGVSSPWVSKCEIVANRKINEKTYEVKIKYYWETSSGASPPSYDTLIIRRECDNWYVKEASSFK